MTIASRHIFPLDQVFCWLLAFRLAATFGVMTEDIFLWKANDGLPWGPPSSMLSFRGFRMYHRLCDNRLRVSYHLCTNQHGCGAAAMLGIATVLVTVLHLQRRQYSLQPESCSQYLQ
jgi:hypothetical protein